MQRPCTQGAPCLRPYPDHADRNGGGPHSHADAVGDIDQGKMDGFAVRYSAAQSNCSDPNDPACTHSDVPDVMGYHTQSDIPNYWSYAQNYVLQDHMFEPNASWSLPAHLFMVSEWSALCTQHDNPSSCTNALQKPGFNPPGLKKPGEAEGPIYAWTDLTYLLHKDKVSWGYYVATGTEPDCENDAELSCVAPHQNSATPGIWTPLPWFDTVQADHQEDN